MRKFKTESKKLLNLMINSIYTNKEIFLRELISNASDAVDKLYFKSLTDNSIEITAEDKAIRVDFDKTARVITVSDNGIGMTKEELDKNLGTIAHSDSMEFKAENADAQGGDVDIIGQFGVGFYSAFMVAKEVRVVSRAYGSEEAWEWVSDGIEGYTIEESQRLTHGTDVILILKPNAQEDDYDQYLSEFKLSSLIERYSNYVRYPIQMKVTKSRELPKPEGAGDDYKPQYESYQEVTTINSMIPIWKRKSAEVTDDEYNDFYHANFHDFVNPLRHFTIHAEGTLEYDALLYIPGRRPSDMYSREYEKGLALYSSNVLIMEKCEKLLPDYYNFVRGVVDSEDLTLNISRETLQHNGQLNAISRRIEKKIKGELENMRDNAREDYEKFFKDFGRSIKYGIYSSYGEAKTNLGDLLLFYSASEEKMITLDEYIEAMPADQEAIYYAAGESAELLAKMPVVRTIRSRGFDVLLCTEDVDEFCLQMMSDYNEKSLKNVSSGDLGLETEEEKAAAEQAAKDNEALFAAMKEALGEEVESVTISTRLTDEPACVTAVGPISFEMERVMATGPKTGNEVKAQRALEINPQSNVFAVLQKAFEADDTAKVELYAKLLYNQALLMEDLPIEDPIAFAQAITQLMV